MRSQLEDDGNSTAISCAVYNYYGNVGNPTSCAIPSQGTGDDGNVVGQFYQDDVNASLSHTASLGYDATHRLTSAVATGSSTYNLAFAYDQFGNMTCTQNQQTQGLCPQYGFNASTNQITNSGYKYDASGDLVSDGAHTYQYDAEGRQVSVDNGATASYVYNALGERVEKDVGGSYTEYVFGKDGNPLGENNRTTWVDTWVDFQGQHIAHYENNETFFVHSGRLGTAGMVTDYSGAVIQDELHYPWGQEWTMAGTMTEERFASLNHRDSATNLDPTHFRMYSSDQGRWLTPDPAPNCPYHPTNFDRYNYAANNPANHIDPHGDALYAGYDYPYIDYGYGFYPPGYGYDEFDYLNYYGFMPIGEIVLEGAGVIVCPECDVIVIGGIVAYQLYLLRECGEQYQRDLQVCRKLSDPGARSRCFASALNRKGRCEQGWDPLPPLITW